MVVVMLRGFRRTMYIVSKAGGNVSLPYLYAITIEQGQCLAP